MSLTSLLKAHSLSCAFFIVSLIFSSAVPAACPPDRIAEQVNVRHVHDGDSLVLSDGRRIRLIGINTPELARDGNRAEPGASEARQALIKLLQQSGNKIGLRYGAERKDRYGRTLAHAFLPDGTNLSAALLRQGSGFPLTIPPNTWQARCYQQQAELARDAKQGVWSMPGWRARSSFNLPSTTSGFQRIIGVLERVGQSRDALWLNLSGDFAARIDRDDLSYFNKVDWNQWQGKRIEITGWVYSSRGKLRMNISHPNAIRRLN